MGKKIQQFCHKHSLTLFNYRKVRKYEYCCSWCEQPLSEMSYRCFECSPPFFLHQLCLHTIPNKFLEHHFHPSHPLYINFFLFSLCAVCARIISKEYCYSCPNKYYCIFQIHICAKLKPTLRHECHNHSLTYIANTRGGAFSECQKCKRDVKKSNLYRCVQCNCNFHFECLMPITATDKYHTHDSLTVMASFKEDGSGEYYCDICEEQRNQEHQVYYCKECTYITHIECALDKVADAEFSRESTSSLKHEEAQQKISDSSIQSEISYFDHNHPLFFKEVIKKYEKPLCERCEVEVCDQAYVCEREECRYYLHKNVLNCRMSDFICDNCREISSGFMYSCFQCNFKLDIKCAVGTASKIVKQGLKEIERPANLFHFIHNHELLLLNCKPTSNRSFWCEACSLKISGPAYCCLECKLYVHESCLEKFPRKIQILSHSQHKFIPFTKQWYSTVCLACKDEDPSFWYKCSQCDIYIHFSCAGSLLQRPLSSKSHSHNLYLFPRDKPRSLQKHHKPRLLQKHQSSKCEKCSKLHHYQSIYHCIECDTNFHLQCVEIFYRVKCKHHIHPLTLKSCFVEDDSGEYYCDVCEEIRDSKNDVYCCEQCDGRFTAHIKCAFEEVEEVLQQYGPFPYSPTETWGDDDVEDYVEVL